MRINIFTDGSCYHKTKLGGIGVYICAPDFYHTISVGYKNTTISRMELRALLEAIRFFDYNDDSICDVYSDSEYVIKSFTESRLFGWLITDFVNVKNVDLWKAVHNEIVKHKIKLNFHHIRGHQKIDDYLVMGNNIADKLANFKTKKFYIEDETEIII